MLEENLNSLNGSRAFFIESSRVEIVLCTNEGSEPLEDRFRVFHPKHGLVELLEHLRGMRCPEKVYALSSMDRLCLLSQDYWDTPWWIRVTCCEPDGFDVRCHIPALKSPGKGAEFSSDTDNASLASDYILAGLDACGGWDRSWGNIPGLSEIIQMELGHCQVTDSRRILEKHLTPTSEEGTVLWSADGSCSKAAAILPTGDDEEIVYIGDGGYTFGRWGVATKTANGWEATRDDCWYSSLEEAFYGSKSWSGEPPAGFYSYRNVSEWRSRPDLRREPDKA